MSLFDSLLGQLGGNLDVAGIASKVGIDPATATQAISALGAAHAAPGDTVDTAAQTSGISTDTLNQVLGHLGGEGALGQIASALQNNPQIEQSMLGMASSFFSKS